MKSDTAGLNSYNTSRGTFEDLFFKRCADGVPYTVELSMPIVLISSDLNPVEIPGEVEDETVDGCGDPSP